MAAIVVPGSTVRAHDDAGPAGSCSTTSTAKLPAATSASEIVYARWNSVFDPSGSGNQNRSHAAGSASTSSNKVGDAISTRTNSESATTSVTPHKLRVSLLAVNLGCPGRLFAEVGLPPEIARR